MESTMADDVPVDNRARELLAAAGLSPSGGEVVFFEMMYPILRSRADTIYTVERNFEA
jgi:hypothetical protein